MRYLIITTDDDGKQVAFFTDYYDFDNHYKAGMIIVDGYDERISFDGKTWQDIEEDHL